MEGKSGGAAAEKIMQLMSELRSELWTHSELTTVRHAVLNHLGTGASFSESGAGTAAVPTREASINERHIGDLRRDAASRFSPTVTICTACAHRCIQRELHSSGREDSIIRLLCTCTCDLVDKVVGTLLVSLPLPQPRLSGQDQVKVKFLLPAFALIVVAGLASATWAASNQATSNQATSSPQPVAAVHVTCRLT